MDQFDQQRERIQADLRGLVAGEVRFDDIFQQLYASDGSIYQIKPLGVVRPRSVADVVACAQYAAEKQIPLHARGSGTGVAGASLGPGLVLDFSRHMRRVLRIDAETVRVQPGIVCERLNAQLRPQARVFGPDPFRERVTTVGSIVAIDAAGSRWLKYGSARRHVRRLQIVLADGHLMDVGREPLAGGDHNGVDPRKRELVRRLAALLGRNADLIRQNRPQGPLDGCGYGLSGVLTEGHLDLARMLVGSEGTLGLITEVTLATQPLPRHRGVALFLFDSLERASRAVLQILPHEPTACDLMDRRHLSLAREAEVRFDLLIPRETEAVLLVEQEGDEASEVRDRVQRLVDEIWHEKRLAFGARQAFDPEETHLFWHLATRVQAVMYPVKGPSRPVPVVEDVAVPPEILPEFLVSVQNVLKRHELTASLFCHAGQGQLHIQPFLDLSRSGDVQRMRRLADELYREVLDVGGTISSGHGCGLSRTSFVRRQVGELYEVFCQVKAIFDPLGTLNPGKIVGDDPDQIVHNLRPPVSPPVSPPPQDRAAPPGEAESPKLRDLVELQLDWDPSRVSPAVADCNRCGTCRTQSPDARMCPIFRSAPSEEASPRAKVNLIAGVLTGGVELNSFTGEEFKAVSNGRPIWAAPGRPVVIWRKAVRITSGMS